MAVKQTHARRVVCAGGVAANSFLRAALQDMAKREHVQLFMPPLHLCGDNAAMIGSQAYYEYQRAPRQNPAECLRDRGYRKEYLRLR
mgnify:CR=1 FL=1